MKKLVDYGKYGLLLGAGPLCNGLDQEAAIPSNEVLCQHATAVSIGRSEDSLEVRIVDTKSLVLEVLQVLAVVLNQGISLGMIRRIQIPARNFRLRAPNASHHSIDVLELFECWPVPVLNTPIGARS